MAFWPRDKGTDALAPINTTKSKLRNYPNLEQGLIGAASLSENGNKRLSWIFASKLSSIVPESCRKHLRLGKAVEIRSPSYALMSDPPITSIRQRAEQSANFLRTYVPDVEIPEELIRKQLIEETSRSQELEKFDPYLGNLIDTFNTRDQQNLLSVAFASGKNMQDLRYGVLSCLDPSSFSQLYNDTLLTFSTPIQQVVCSRPNGNFTQGPNIAVRTYGATEVFKVDYAPTRQPSVKQLKQLNIFTRKALNNEAVVDMKHSMDSLHIILVGGAGYALTYDLLSGNPDILSFRPNDDPSENNDDFMRLALGPSQFDYLLMSKKEVFHLDKRTNSSTVMHALPGGKHSFTSIEDCHTDNTLLLCSTNQVVWMDMRFPRTPLLAYAHGREYSRYLSAKSINGSISTPTTVVTSRSNSMITVYDVTRSAEGLASLNTAPYCLSSNQGMYQTHIGQHVIDRGDFSVLLQLTEGAGLTYNELRYTNCQVVDGHTGDKLAVEDGERRVSTELQPEIGPLGCQECSQVDLSGAYEEMFDKHFRGIQVLEDEMAQAPVRILNKNFLSSYVPNKQHTVDYLLTTHDIAIRVSDSDQAMGASFLAESSINSRGSYEALKQRKISPQSVKTPWHVSLLPTLRKSDSQLSDDASQMRDNLEKFKLSHGKDNVRRYEEDSCRELVLDLAFSFDTFSEVPLSKFKEVDQTLEVMTKALSLGDEPPTIEFGFLKPVVKELSADDENVDLLDIPIGVQLLLQNWDTSDPETFVYQDPYNVVNEDIPVKFKHSPSQSQSQHPIGNNQRPPTILTSNPSGFARPDPLRKPVPKVQSQSQFQSLLEPPRSWAEPSQPNVSQDYIANTQILPGPHGGRPNVKKKPAKKRLGGF